MFKYILVSPEDHRLGLPPSTSNENPVRYEQFFDVVKEGCPAYVVVSKFATDEKLRGAAQKLQKMKINVSFDELLCFREPLIKSHLPHFSSLKFAERRKNESFD